MALFHHFCLKQLKLVKFCMTRGSIHLDSPCTYLWLIISAQNDGLFPDFFLSLLLGFQGVSKEFLGVPMGSKGFQGCPEHPAYV